MYQRPDQESESGDRQKLRILEREKPGNWLLTGMSDLCAWKEEWLQAVFQKLKDNPQHEAVFLLKRPDLLKEDLVPIIGEENMVQELPAEFNKILEEQKKWNSLV